MNKRTLPWRDISDPYAIWVSETMLQQTRVETVLAYYPRFIARFPTIKDLAQAPEQDILKAWEGLGYYSRARNMQKAARQVMKDFQGEMPCNIVDLRRLAGIGPYTAGAVASIAFSVKTPAIDGNVSRVVSRLMGIREDISIPSVRRQLQAEADSLVPAQRPGDFNQAVMDLGATVCLPGTPACEKCPLCGHCSAYEQGDAELLPVKMQARAPRQIAVGVGLITFANQILVHQRQEKLLGGLWVFLLCHEGDTLHDMEKKLKSLGIPSNYRDDCGSAKHVFTHQVWNMHLMHFEAEDALSLPGYSWVNHQEIEQLPFPTAMKAAKRKALELLHE